MATASANPEKTDMAPPRRFGKKLLIIALIVLAGLLLAGAGVVGLLLVKKGGTADGTGTDTPASMLVDLSRPPTFATLDPFVVNLLPGEGERYLQVVLAFRVADSKTADSLKGFMPEIRHRINLLLSSKLPSELSTLAGREDLASQMADEVNQVLGAPPAHTSPDGLPTGPVRAVLFNSFIIQ